ncbi:MAG: adenylosuccinate lyase, partial [Cyanobacteria bacterium P01_C01_bin.73]
MIERYTLPEMGDLWTDTHKLQTWLRVEIAVCEAQAELGYIPAEAVEEIKAKANFDPDRVLEIEAEVR